MARSDRSYKELREMILDAAYDLVLNKGIKAVSIRSIANEIGYSIGTVYNMFSGMDEIVLYLNDRVLSFFVDKLKEELKKSHLSAMDNLLLIARCYLNFSKSHYNLWHLLFINKSMAFDKLPKWYYKKIDELFRLVAHYISLLNLPALDIELEALMYWAGVHGIASLSQANKLRYISPEDNNIILEKMIKRMIRC